MAPNVPTINTHMMMSSQGGTGPYAGPPSASASIGTYSAGGGGANDSRQSLLGGRRPPPLQIPTDDPEQIGAALQPRTPTHSLSPAFPAAGQGRGSPSHSYSLPMSQSNSTLSSHSHSHGHSHSPSLQYTTTAGRSPITATFPRSTSTSSSSQHHTYAGSANASGSNPFMQPPSRPASAASHSHGHSHSQQLAHPAPPQQQQQHHYPQPPASPYARSPGGAGLPPSSSDGGHSRMSESRSRGNSAASGELRDGAARDRDRDRDRERERDGGAKRDRERERERSRKEKDPRAGGGASSSRDAKVNGSATPPALCAKCDLPMTGQFVRALGTVYHLDCFRCMVSLFALAVLALLSPAMVLTPHLLQDCNKVVAAKFFPIDAPDGSGRQVPLCETDYFRRLNLLCSKCGQALRGSYITALGKRSRSHDRG